jgi:hypothetical protein
MPNAGNSLCCLSLTVVSYLTQMGAHRRARFFRIMALDGFQDLFVVNLPALRAAGNAKDAEPLLAQKSNDGIEQRKNERIFRTFRQGQMKVEISLDIGFRILSGSIHDRDRLAHRGQFRFLNADSSEGSDFRLENRANFRQVSGAFRLADLDHEIEGLADGLGGSVGDEGSASGKSFDETFFAKRLDGLAHCSAADSETLGELAFGGKLVARFQSALDNGFLDLLNDLFVKAGRSNEFVHCAAPGQVRREAGGTGADDGPTTIPQIQRN